MDRGICYLSAHSFRNAVFRAASPLWSFEDPLFAFRWKPPRLDVYFAKQVTVSYCKPFNLHAKKQKKNRKVLLCAIIEKNQHLQPPRH